MNCKTCHHSIEKTTKFCSNCGAKIVEGRLSLKGTWEEFVGPFFSWDNNFWRTFFGLFKNPKDVLEAYISGARKKYFHPFSYIILYATIAVFFYKFFPLDFSQEFNEGFTKGFNSSGTTSKVPKIDMKSYMEIFMSYYNFFVLAFLPIYALTSYIIYSKKGHNFFEHLVFNSYLQTNLGFCSLLLQLILVNAIGMPFMTYSYFFYIIFIIYTIYGFKKLYGQNIKQSLISAIKYILLFIILYMAVIIVFSIIFGLIMLVSMLSKS